MTLKIIIGFSTYFSKHRDKTICLTNPEDFTIEIL